MKWINQQLTNKKFRLYVALFSIVQGLYRTDLLIGQHPINDLFRNFNLIFGVAVLIVGIAMFVSLFMWRNIVFSKISISVAAALYVGLGVSALSYSMIGAIGAFAITAILLLEAGVINEQ